jgi:ABC-type Fe3+/spermidine/putrescine transport system ATPase subunit
MNVFDNVAFGLRIARMPGEQVHRRVAEMLELVGLTGFEERDVNTLSGGEQQRVALARSLTPQPRLLMLDEPLGSLDRTLRERLLLDLRQILRRIHQTTMYVTHDQEEAFTLADRVAVMNAGRVEQTGSPMEIYRHPATVFVARFLGLTNLLPGQASRRNGRVIVKTALGAIPAPEGVQGEVTVLLRPEEAALNGRGDFILEGTVVEQSFRGSTCRMAIEANGTQLAFEFPSRADLPAEGEPIRLGFETGEGIQFIEG